MTGKIAADCHTLLLKGPRILIMSFLVFFNLSVHKYTILHKYQSYFSLGNSGCLTLTLFYYLLFLLILTKYWVKSKVHAYIFAIVRQEWACWSTDHGRSNFWRQNTKPNTFTKISQINDDVVNVSDQANQSLTAYTKIRTFEWVHSKFSRQTKHVHHWKLDKTVTNINQLGMHRGSLLLNNFGLWTDIVSIKVYAKYKRMTKSYSTN